MKNNHQQKELNEIARELGLSAAAAEELRRDIQAGDELLETLAAAPMPPAVQAKIRCAITQRLAQRRRMRLARAIAAVVVLALTVAVWSLRERPAASEPVAAVPNAEPPALTAQQRELWETVLLHEELQTTSDELDSITLMELSGFYETPDTLAAPEPPATMLPSGRGLRAV